MEKQLVNPYEKEYMKLAMLKHEQTFKEQVCELHRLYRIQKILMKNIQSNGLNNGHSQERWMNSSKYGASGSKNHTIIVSDRDLQQKKPHRKLDLERPAKEYVEELDCHGNNGMQEIEDEGEIKLTLGPTSYTKRKQKGDQTPLTSDSGPSFSSSSTGSSHMKKTGSSSGTHQRADRSTRKELNSSQWVGLVQNEIRNTNLDVEEQLRQERLKQPPWILQALSLT